MRGDIVIYGAEDREGRAFLAISALHHCGRWLAEREVGVRFVAVGHGVPAAIEILGNQTGLKMAVDSVSPKSNPEVVFANAGLYVGVVFSKPGVLALGEARKRDVPCLSAVQFPSEQHLTVSVLDTMRCAFDPVELSRRIRSEVSRLQCANNDA